jgi:integrase
MYYDERKRLWRKRVPRGNAKYLDLYGATKIEVREKVRIFEQVMGKSIDDSIMFGDYAQRWLGATVPLLSEASKRSYTSEVHAHLAPFFGEMRIASIRPIHVQEFISKKQGYATSYIRRLVSTLHLIMESALDDKIIEHNPVSSKRLGGVKTEAKEALSPTEVNELLKAVRGTNMEAFTNLCLFAGLRREEALGLLWSDLTIRKKGSFLEVKRAFVFPQGELRNELKSKAAHRKVPVPAVLLHALGPKGADNERVCGNLSTGQAIRGYTRAFSKVPFHVTPHILRHTYITSLIIGGMDVKSTQTLAGHASANITLDIYSHFQKSKADEIAKKIEILFSGFSRGNDE